MTNQVYSVSCRNAIGKKYSTEHFSDYGHGLIRYEEMKSSDPYYLELKVIDKFNGTYKIMKKYRHQFHVEITHICCVMDRL